MKIITLSMRRGSGKTTLVKQIIDQDNDAILLVPSNSFRNDYDSRHRNRIFTFAEFLNHREEIKGLVFNKIIIDEAYCLSKDELAKLYYHLGIMGVEVMAIGTVGN